MGSFLIKNARVVLPSGIEEVSVAVEGDKIVGLDVGVGTASGEIVEARGLYLLPGLVDDQVHFREPGLTHKEDFAHATRAAAKGGVTSILEMPNTIPTTTTVERLHAKLELAASQCLVNFGFYIGATPTNLEELKTAQRTPGIKIFIGSSTGELLVDNQTDLERIFAETSLPICAHCEDETTIRKNAASFAGRTDVATHSLVRDHLAAEIATRRAIDLATRHRHPFHVLHVSTANEVELLRHAPDWVTAEVCPHHLFFNIDDYARLGALIKMNPSIKTRADNEALWGGLQDGAINVIATDHAPHTITEKQLPFPECPSGLPAVENSLALMLDQVNSGKCSLEQVVRWMSSEPARIWDLVGKGRIEPGADADLVLVDLDLEQQIDNRKQETKCGWSPWHGQRLKGWAVRTWVMGQEVFRWEDGQPKFNTRVRGREILFGQRRRCL